MKPVLCSMVLALVLVIGGCDTAGPDARFGIDLLGLEFEVTDPNEGIFPNRSVLANERNPFRHTDLSLEARFGILESGAAAATFYAWATQLAREPTGENQYYTALGLARVFASNSVKSASQLDTVRLMTIGGAQSVLDNFPDSVTFDATGTVPFRLATPAYLLILELGGQPQGDWILVEKADGSVEAVRGSAGEER